MIHLIEHYLRLALRSFCDPPAEDVGDPIRGDPGKTKITGSLEDRMDRMVAFENDVLGMLNLADEVVATKVHAVTFVTAAQAPQGSGVQGSGKRTWSLALILPER